jgi:hypothetical protein
MDTRLGWLVLAAILRGSSVVGGTPAADVNSVFIEGSSQFAGFRFEPTSHTEAMAGDRAHTRSRTPPPPPPPANGTITVSVGSGTTLPAGGAWVNVTTTCTPTTAGWWVGLFPAETASIVVAANPADPKLGNNTGSPFTPPFVLPAPLKFVGGCGLVREWWVPDVRQPLAFVLMSGGTSGGTSVERARTSRLTHGSPGHPMHVRLGRTALSTEMRVSWTSASIVSPTVRWGNSPTSLTNLASASSTTYTSSDLCGEPARTLGWFDPGWHHTTVLDLSGSPPGTTLYYAVSSAGMTTPTRQFRVPSIGPQTTLRVVLTADMGATAIDKASQHWAEAQACVTTASMAAWAAEKQADLAFNVGDLSYATGYLGKWETFMSAIEPLSATVPYVVAQGNHEQDWPGTGAVTNGPLAGRDSGGECGVPAASRFMVGSSASSGDPKPISYWYSFDAGPVHFVVVNTEISSLWNGTQYQWLESDLTRVNRSETPWIVMMGHRNEFDGRCVQVFSKLWGGVDVPWFTSPLLSVATHNPTTHVLLPTQAGSI